MAERVVVSVADLGLNLTQFFFRLCFIAGTWDGLDSVIERGGAPEEKLRALMDAREFLPYSGNYELL